MVALITQLGVLVARHRRSLRLAGGVYAVCFAALAVLLSVTGTSVVNWYKLAADGRHGTGRITQIQLNNHDTCSFTYRVGGHRYDGYDECPANSASVGGPIAIVYERGNPSISTSQSPTSELAWDIELMLLAPAIVAGFIVWRAKRKRGSSDFVP